MPCDHGKFRGVQANGLGHDEDRFRGVSVNIGRHEYRSGSGGQRRFRFLAQYKPPVP